MSSDSDDEKACYCDSRQCEVCTPEPLAASNARLCDIALKADEVVKAAERLLEEQRALRNVDSDWAAARRNRVRLELIDALDAYKQARNGQ